MILVIDNYDSFTYNLVDYFAQLGYLTDVVLNDVDAKNVDFAKYNAIVVSPGPETPEKSNNLLDLINTSGELPLLGVCLGLQAIAHIDGASIKRMEKPFHGKASAVYHQKNSLFEDIPSPFSAVRYHSWAIDNLPKEYESIANTADGTIMAIKHVTRPWYGVQFHPESILTEHGITLLRNWASIVGI